MTFWFRQESISFSGPGRSHGKEPGFLVGERISLDLITDMFNLVNKFNVASVNQLWTNAGSRRRLTIRGRFSLR
jgi:hypothetical protein